MGSNSNSVAEQTVRPVFSSSNPRQSLDQGRTKADKSAGGKSRRFSLLPTSFSLRNMGESRHERKISRSSSRQYGQPAQPAPAEVQSQPQLGVPANDAASHMSGSEASLAAGSAPPSAFRASTDHGPVSAKKTMLSKHKKFGDAFEGEVSSGGHGSSGPARRVMDFFRRRGTARSKSEKTSS